MIALSASQDNIVGIEAAEAKEMLRIGAWSVRRAPGGPDAGLLYVNLETGRAQKEPPPEVLQELEMDPEEAEGNDADGDAAEDVAGGQQLDSRPGSRGSGSRPGTGRRSSRSGSGDTGSPPAAAEALEAPKFRRILLGNSQDLPLKMARDIQSAIKEDITFFDLAQKRYSDAPREEFDFEACPEELEAVAAALSPGEISGVVGTDLGMQIVLRVC